MEPLEVLNLAMKGVIKMREEEQDEERIQELTEKLQELAMMYAMAKQKTPKP
jgi:hypothetical protein